MLTWLHAGGTDYLSLRQSAHVVEQLAFSTKRKYMATVVDSPLLDRKVLYVKGAPEIVLGMCERVAGDVPRDLIAPKLLEYQSHAFRTLGFAYCYIDDERPVIEGESLRKGLSLEFTGICAISDCLLYTSPSPRD